MDQFPAGEVDQIQTGAIIPRKIVRSEGVKHEIDLWVELDVGDGYEALFIFECKNWKAKVGKNEVIVFSEKISVTGANRGYIVAETFTADAVAQIAKDPRMSRRTVTTDNLSPLVGMPLQIGLTNIHSVQFDADVPSRRSEPTALVTGQLSTRRGPVTLADASHFWATKATNEELQGKAHEDYATPHTIRRKWTLVPGDLALDGEDARAVAVTVTFSVASQTPAIISSFDVQGRGRHIQFEQVTLNGSKIDLEVVERALGVNSDGAETWILGTTLTIEEAPVAYAVISCRHPFYMPFSITGSVDRLSRLGCVVTFEPGTGMVFRVASQPISVREPGDDSSTYNLQ